VERARRGWSVRHTRRHLPDRTEPRDRQEGGGRPGGIRATSAHQIQIGPPAGAGRGDRWTDYSARQTSEADEAGVFGH